jgi:hypothetical protein
MVSRAQFLLSFWFVAIAGGASAYVSGGHEYDPTCNVDGYVLTSKYPVARTIGQGAATQFTTGIEKLYLGRSCDAFHASLGSGQWCWANGGFVASFSEMEFGFGRQELYCPSNEDLGLECRCD